MKGKSCMKCPHKLLFLFRIFAQQCRNIEELVLDGCRKISDRYVLTIDDFIVVRKFTVQLDCLMFQPHNCTLCFSA